MSGFNVTVTGIEDVNRILREIAPNEARNLMRATVTDMAKQIAKDAKGNAPSDQGDLAAAIHHKRERETGDREVIRATAKVAKSAFYWRYLEYGQGPDGVEHAFFLKAVNALKPDLERLYLRIFADKLVKRLARLHKKSGG